jgi:hypothetical protein
MTKLEDKRLQHIRDQYQRMGEAALERACGELLAHIDALALGLQTAETRRAAAQWAADNNAGLTRAIAAAIRAGAKE